MKKLRRDCKVIKNVFTIFMYFLNTHFSGINGKIDSKDCKVIKNMYMELMYIMYME